MQTGNVTQIATAAVRRAAWFGLEVDTGGGKPPWRRVELVTDDGDVVRFWPRGVPGRGPEDIAALFGPGRYRTVWLSEKRKNRTGSDEPFVIDADGAPRPDAQPDEPPPAAPPAVAPMSSAAVPAPVRRVGELAAGVLPQGTKIDEATASFVLVHGLSMQSMHSLLEQNRLQLTAQLRQQEHQAQQALAQQQLWAQQQQAQQQGFFAAMLEQQRQTFEHQLRVDRDAAARVSAAELRAAELARPDPSAAMAPLVERLEELGERVEELAERDDDDEAPDAPPDPDKVERVANAIGGVLKAANDLGVGPILQRLLVSKLGIPEAPAAVAALPTVE